MFATVLNFRLIVLIIILNASLSWGVSVSGTALVSSTAPIKTEYATNKFNLDRTQKYIGQAQSEKLWTTTKWLKLNQYTKTLFGYESAFRGPLFLDATGYRSPKEELLKSIEVLFSESKDYTEKFKRHPQCQFLARTRWLKKVLFVDAKDLVDCKERDSWKKELNAQAVSLIFASADLGNPASSFGHTFLKVLNPQNAKNKDLIDYGVNYAADADETDMLYAMKGLFGFYGGRFTMLPYHQKQREYINLEGRDIWEYQLNLTPEETDELVDHLLEFENSTAPYFFFDDNCSYRLLRSIEVVRPELNLASQFKYFVIPIDTVKKVVAENNLVIAKKFKKSVKTDYLESYVDLNVEQKTAVKDVIQNKLDLEKTKFTPKEKAEVYETAMKYYAIQSFKDGKDYENEKYNLSVNRAVLGAVTQQKQTEVPFAPDQSHDSSAVYLGGGYNQKSETNFYSFKFRHAFHDLEQVDLGTVKFSHVEIAGFDFRYDEDRKKTTLHDFTFVRLVNTNPANELEQNISWKIHAHLQDPYRPAIDTGGGMSYDLAHNLRLTSFISGGYSTRCYLTDIDEKFHQVYLGPELLLIYRPIKSIGLSLTSGYFGRVDEKSFLRTVVKLNYQIIRNSDLQIDWQNQNQETQIRWVQNFIF